MSVCATTYVFVFDICMQNHLTKHDIGTSHRGRIRDLKLSAVYSVYRRLSCDSATVCRRKTLALNYPNRYSVVSLALAV